MTAILETHNLSIQFGGVVGASEISVTVNKGEVIGVIGANGAGKTTFVNLVTGYLKPSSGTIHYMGSDVTKQTPREITSLGIRRSFQIPQLFGEMTALENMVTAQSVAPKVTRSYWMPLKRSDTVEHALERLEHMLQLHVSYVELRQGISFIVIAEAAQFEEPRVRSAGRRLVEKYLSLVSEIISQGIERDEIDRTVLPSAAAMIFFGMIQSAVTRWLFDPSAHPLSENAVSMWQLFRTSLEHSDDDADRRSKENGGN